MLVFKLFDLYTQKYILADPQDPESVLTEEVENSLLEIILPSDAADKLSLADIEMGMDGEIVEGNHPDPENNVLLLNKGSRGLYGPPEYKKLIEPFLDTTKDYPYHRYLSNENKSLQTRDIKVWVIDDEEAMSGIPEVSSDRARVILGDSHGKVSYELGTSLGDPTRLVQYRMLGVDTPFFSKGTFQAALGSTLDFHELDEVPALKGIDMILPTSSIKGSSKSNLPPGVHTVKVHLAAHKEGSKHKYTMRAATEKLEGDFFSYALKQQTAEIAKINESFGDRQKLLEEFVKSLEPAMMSDPDNPGQEIPFDPERWEQCGKPVYIAARHDFESGHQQLLQSPIYSSYINQFFASRARKAAELEFVKVDGAMVFCSHQLENDEICIPDLPEGEVVAAVRSPIIKLQDIAVVKNRHISDMYNDNGDLMQGAYICSPQTYDRIVNGMRSFVVQQTASLVAAEIDTSQLDTKNPFNWSEYRDAIPAAIEGSERAKFVEAINLWREAYNDLVVENQVNLPQLEQIRADTFTAILAADFDGDNVAIVPQSKYPELVAGIADKIVQKDSITEKLEKIKLEGGNETLGSVLARKSDPFILGKTANLAENLQSYAVEARRLQRFGSEKDKQSYLRKIAPAFYYLLAEPNQNERALAEKQNSILTFRDYQISSTGSGAISEAIVARFDLYNLARELPNVLNFGNLSEPHLDRALALWQDLVLDLNDKVAQQNQIAVDTFKSERQVDSEFVEGLSRRLRYLNDGLKKTLDLNTTYYSEIPKINDSTTNRSLLVENVNRNLKSFKVEPTPYSRIAHLFPPVNNPSVNQEVASAIAKYKNFYKLSRLYRDKSSIDSGPSLVLVHDGKKIEISNILSQDYTPARLRKLAENGGLELKLVKNTKDNATHKFYALVKEDGQWKSLGTLCNACAALNDITEPIEFGKIDRFDFVTPVGVHQATAYGSRAQEVAENLRASLVPEQIDLYAAATFGALVKTSNQSNNMGFMFAAFGEEMIRAVRQLEVEKIRLNTLSDVEIPTEPVSLLFDRDETDSSKQAVFILDPQGQKTKLGLVDDAYYHPRMGATVTANIEYTPPSTGTFTLSDGEQFTIGGMTKADANGELFNDLSVEVELDMLSATTRPVFKLNGKILGAMSERTANFLQSQGDLVEGKQLDVSLNSEGVNFARKIKATAANGDLFEIIDNYKIGHQNTKNHSFSDEEATITVGFQTQKQRLGAFIIRDGKRVSVGEFNNRHRASQAKVESLGLVGKRFTASLKNNVTTLDLAIDPKTIDYSQSQSTTTLAEASIGTEVNPTTEALLEQMLRFKPILRYGDRLFKTDSGNSLVEAMDLLIDVDAVDSYRSFLNEFEFQQVSPEIGSTALATQKGFAVFTLPAAKVTTKLRNRLQQELKIDRVFDEKIQGKVAADAFTQTLSQYSNVKLVEQDNSQVTTAELPIFDASSLNEPDRAVPSSNLLYLLAAKSQERDLLLALDRYDYGWLNSQLETEMVLADPAAVEAHFKNGDNLFKARKLVEGYLTESEATVYQHLTAGTDLRYREQLLKIAGAETIDKVKSLIERRVTPLYIPDGDLPQSIPSLKVSRSLDYSVPLPDAIARGVKPGIVLGNPNSDLSLALSDPQNYQVKDLKRPVNFENVTYSSVQDAVSTLRKQRGFEATKDLPEQLLAAKLIQYPELLTQIERNGGVKWLYQNSYSSENKFMSGQGRDSGLVRTTVAAYKSATAAIALWRETELDNSTSDINYLTEKMFEESSAVASGTTISNWTSKDPLAAALSMATNNALYRKNIDRDYPVSFGGNPERQPNRNLKVEKYFKLKPSGEPFTSAEDAYQHFASGLNNNQKYELMVDILTAKLEQHPDLVKGIAERGGTKWLAKCSYRDPNQDSFWAGQGNNSGFIKALARAYGNLRQKTTGIAASSMPVESTAESIASDPQPNVNLDRHDRMGAEATSKDVSKSTNSAVELNPGQQKALAGLVEFATGNNDEQFAVLSGSAGTGKSFTVTQLLQQIKAKNPHLKIGFTAPTHAAVTVLNNMAKEAGIKPDSLKTLAATLGIKPELDVKTGVETFKVPRGHEFKLPDILVVDEASMIGSELYGHIQEAAAVTGARIIMMGDKIQLPPVGELISPAFADESIASRYELNEIMRYDGDIIVTADKMRQQVERVQAATSIAELEQANVDYQIPSSGDGQIVTGKSSDWEKSVLQEFASPEFKADPNHIKVVAYTNSRVKELNQNIRSRIFGSDASEYLKGDVMVSLGIFSGSDVDNRDRQLNTSEGFTIDSARKGTDRDTGYKVWQIAGHSLNTTDASGAKAKTPVIMVVAAESKQQYKADLKKLATQARQTRNWQPYFALRDKYQSVDYGYAITTHRSQGSTFNKVAIDRTNFDLRLGHFNKGSNFADKKQALQEYYQLMYVALTRAKAGVMIADDARVRDISFESDNEPTVAPDTSFVPEVQGDSGLEESLKIVGVNFATNNQQDSFAAALTNPTENAKYKGSITRSYPISFRGNPFRPANTSCKAEKYFQDKPAGEPFVSAEDAYQHFKVGLNNDRKFDLMVEILAAKLEQYPRLANEITKRGGKEFLAASSHQVYGNDKFWEGQGLNSGFVKALSLAYQRTLEAKVTPTATLKTANTEVSPEAAISQKPQLPRDMPFSTPSPVTVPAEPSLPGVQLDNDDVLEAKDLQDLSKSIQHLGTLDEATQSAILEHLNAMKGQLNSDVSQYAKGRENFWLGTQWNLKDKQFESSGVWNSKLWELCKRVYPDADMALITYSGDEAPAGINLHRDDSYAAFEARSISIETVPRQETKWQFQQRYPGMNWTKQQNADAPVVDFSIPSGSITAFNCKNPHAAIPGVGRWSINLWQISNKQRDNYQAHIGERGINGGSQDLGVNLPDIPLPAPINLTLKDRSSLSAPKLHDRISNVDISALPGVQSDNDDVLATLDSLKNQPLEPSLPAEVERMMSVRVEPAVSDSTGIYSPAELETPSPKAEVQKTTDSVKAFVSIPGVAAKTTPDVAIGNIADSKHLNLKQVVSSVFDDFASVEVNSSLKFWQDKSQSDRASDSFVATFNDATLESTLYSAAKVGRELDLPRMSFFAESQDGSDLMYVLDLPHTDRDSIRDTLEVFGLSSYTLVSQPDSTKVILADRGAKQPNEIVTLAKQYNQQVQIYAGTFQSIVKEKYPDIIAAYEASHRDVRTSRHRQADDRIDLQGNNLGGQSPRPRIRTASQRAAAIEAIGGIDSVIVKLAGKANKFIGNSGGSSNTKLNAIASAWGDNDLESFTPQDKVFICGPTIEDLPPQDIKQLFATYQPTLDLLVAAGSKVLLTDNPGTDRLVAKYLARSGYTFKDSGKGYLMAWNNSLAKDSPSQAMDASVLRSAMPVNIAQQQRVDEASVVMTQLINSTHDKKSFDTGKYLLSFDRFSNTLKAIDKTSGSILVDATYDKAESRYLTNSTALTLSNAVIGELKDTLDNLSRVSDIPQPLANRFERESCRGDLGECTHRASDNRAVELSVEELEVVSTVKPSSFEL